MMRVEIDRASIVCWLAHTVGIAVTSTEFATSEGADVEETHNCEQVGVMMGAAQTLKMVLCLVQ